MCHYPRVCQRVLKKNKETANCYHNRLTVFNIVSITRNTFPDVFQVILVVVVIVYLLIKHI